MSVATSTYKVGDLYTTQKSKVTGTIVEINPQANGNVRVKLDVNGSHRYTTWTAKQSNYLIPEHELKRLTITKCQTHPLYYK